MKIIKAMLMILILGFITAACAQEDTEEEPQFLDVQLTATPEKAEVGEEITFEAKVTYGSEKVEDADEVKFEIWRSQAENHEKMVIQHDEDGVYKLKKSFSEEGTYYIISHVTARSMHNMPKIEFVVGNPSEPETDSANETEEMDMENSDEGHNNH